jgi:hypothetical protein
MSTRTIRTPDGGELVMSSDDLSHADLVLAEVLLEMSAARGSLTISMDDDTMDEIASRVRAKGYDPSTGEPIN